PRIRNRPSVVRALGAELPSTRALTRAPIRRHLMDGAWLTPRVRGARPRRRVMGMTTSVVARWPPASAEPKVLDRTWLLSRVGTAFAVVIGPPASAFAYCSASR